MAVVKKYLHDLDLVRNKLMNPLLNPLTSSQRLALSLTLADEGYTTFDTTLNNIYVWDGSTWITSSGGGSGTVTSVGVTSGTGISASVANPTTTPNITITNTAPDQTVVLNNGTGINVTGTYPNFTIAATGTGGGTLVALPFTTDHLATTNNEYVVGDIVWYLGDVYRCIANNDSLTPSTSPAYWTLLGAGFPLVQQPVDWNSTSGNNQILNKPTIPTGTVTGVTATSPITSSGGTAPVISTSMATDRLIGRTTAGVGVMEEITVGTGLTLSGGTLNATAQVPGFEMNFLLMGA